MKTLCCCVLVFFALLAAVANAACGSCSAACPLRLPALVTGPTDTQPYSNVSCVFRYGPRGSWYSVVGTGKTLQVDTCDERNNFDTVLMVFKSCKQTNGVYDDCLAMDDDGCSQRHSKIMFFADTGRTYYIFVTGYLDSVGLYYLSVTEPTEPTAQSCKNAIEVPRFPFVSDSDTSSSLSVRDGCLGKQSAGMWYHLSGDGEPFVAHTCSLNTNFDTIIEVYLNCTEDGEGGEPCLTYNDDSCYKQSLVTWRSVMNTDYWVFVTGSNNERGIFSLVIEDQALNPHSRCTDAIDIITFPYQYTGTTVKLQEAFGECTQKNHNGMWFRMHGLNRQVLISTCNDDNYNGDSVIEVYSHCNSETQQAVQCVDHNDDYCGMNAAVILDAYAPLYYIWVYGFTPGVEGINFTLTVTPFEPGNNSQCWQASEIDVLPMDFSGTTRNRPHCHAGCDGSGAERFGAWFRYVHFGRPTIVGATTCNKQNILQARLEVYNDCHTMRCHAEAPLDPKTNCTTVTFAVENGRTYNVLLTANSASTPANYYHIDFFEQKTSNHSQCTDANIVPMDHLPFRTQQYTRMSEPSWSACSHTTKQGYWVRVYGDGNKYVASTCDTQTDFDTVIELYDRCPTEGSSAGCVDYSDDHFTCGLASILEWQTQKGAVYWIFVGGHMTDVGMFVLTIYHMESPSNAHCLTGKGIVSLPYHDYGLTTYAIPSNASCGFGRRKGVWYTFVGDDRHVIVDTCGIETTFETEVEIYMACTKQGGQICVNHAHDNKCAPQTVIEFPAFRFVPYWVFITGAHTDVMAEGFFNVKILPGKKIQPLPSSSEKVPQKPKWTTVLYVILGVVAGMALIVGATVAGFVWYKKRRIDYVQIGGADTAPVNAGDVLH